MWSSLVQLSSVGQVLDSLVKIENDDMMHRRLCMLPRETQAKSEHIGVYLHCIGKAPIAKVKFQLWLKNHKGPANTAYQGKSFLLCTVLGAVIVCTVITSRCKQHAEECTDFTESRAWGTDQLLA